MSSGRFHKIRGLRVTGGFLDGLDIRFDPRLSCVIGGRGSGKTTVLEFLRFALNEMPDADRSAGQRRHIMRLLQGNLQTGRITVEVETKDGLVYFVERSLGEEPEVLDDARRPTSLSLDHRAIFSAEGYRRREVRTSPRPRIVEH